MIKFHNNDNFLELDFLTCGALIQVATRNTVRIKNVAFGTRTNEAALRVLTRELARCWIQFALVDV